MKLTLGLFAAMVGLHSFAEGSQVVLTVRDTEDGAVAKADVELNFRQPRPQSHVLGKTDESGRFRAEGTGMLGLEIDVKRLGYYSASLDSLLPAGRMEKTLILPAIKRPIPLFVRQVGQGSNTDGVFKAENEWLGFDLQVGDWVAPHGKGEVTDLRFRYRHEFQGYRLSDERIAEEMRVTKEIAVRDRREWTEDWFKGRYGRWSGEMEVAFVGDQEGMVEVVDRYLPYSQLKMPHEAPAEGYGPGRKYALNNYSPTGLRDDVGFFLRTRVKLDDKGAIVSANYTKVIHDFRFWAEGQVEFIYYFNPTPNDRNLEFDPARNLFPKSPQTENMRSP
jgi:hypothetical protein